MDGIKAKDRNLSTDTELICNLSLRFTICFRRQFGSKHQFPVSTSFLFLKDFFYISEYCVETKY